ncbi:MAG: DUF6285 domain-containing protein [Solirubrobacterales bacterium]
MQDRPTAPELLDAMAAELYDEVREWVPRERRFRILVLANLCAVIARELRTGESALVADTRLFMELLGEEGGADPRDAAAVLARRIRAGELDDSLDQTIDRLREHVARKLDVARPGYAESGS